LSFSIKKISLLRHIDNNTLKLGKKFLKNIKNIVIITHFNPDGDAIGSSLGLYHYLNNENYNVSVLIPNSSPQFLHWLPGNDKILVFDDKPDKCKSLINEAELIVYLDFNVLDRTQGMEKFLNTLKTNKILIDHHPDPENFADVIISTTNVSSTSELLYNFLVAIGGEEKIDKAISECLYTGIMTDTGSFSYNSSSPDTYFIVSRLIENGIDKDKIYWNVYDNYSADRMRLLGYCLNQKMKVLPEYATAYISISKDELERFNYQSGDSEGFVNYPLSIKNIVFSVIFIEHESHIKISFRSKGDFYANRFATENFNGGGHRNAAGGYSESSLEETLEAFERALQEYQDELLTSKL
jgi:phosphoesterase RecJ-like protein